MADLHLDICALLVKGIRSIPERNRDHSLLGDSWTSDGWSDDDLVSCKWRTAKKELQTGVDVPSPSESLWSVMLKGTVFSKRTVYLLG